MHKSLVVQLVVKLVKTVSWFVFSGDGLWELVEIQYVQTNMTILARMWAFCVGHRWTRLLFTRFVAIQSRVQVGRMSVKCGLKGTFLLTCRNKILCYACFFIQFLFPQLFYSVSFIFLQRHGAKAQEEVQKYK